MDWWKRTAALTSITPWQRYDDDPFTTTRKIVRPNSVPAVAAITAALANG